MCVCICVFQTHSCKYGLYEPENMLISLVIFKKENEILYFVSKIIWDWMVCLYYINNYTLYKTNNIWTLYDYGWSHWKLVHIFTIMSVPLLIYSTNQNFILRSHIFWLKIYLYQMHLRCEANLRSWFIWLDTILQVYFLEMNSYNRSKLVEGRQCHPMFIS